ncbi:Pleiotropic drug resistance protein 1-like [Heracleum sosnowskyi]|uniref:Pleiotropic drug resistance protein 1-like n=1 Tax=Heracleum sosnowskyi TaxID=360622 RepID=A0AAD8M704_9APIA|nr:Pleiotropic drug resistance protein 1-like [Heracleum sosnowskyi]
MDGSNLYNLSKNHRDRVDRVGIDLRQIEVRFEHLKIEAEAHVGSKALPSFLNFCIATLHSGKFVFALKGLLDTLHIIPRKKERLNVLNDVSGVIRTCRMTLLLGPPSSGKTTLLLDLAGKPDPTLKFSGRLSQVFKQNVVLYSSTRWPRHCFDLWQHWTM